MSLESDIVINLKSIKSGDEDFYSDDLVLDTCKDEFLDLDIEGVHGVKMSLAVYRIDKDIEARKARDLEKQLEILQSLRAYKFKFKDFIPFEGGRQYASRNVHNGNIGSWKFMIRKLVIS